jgi:hypothetical protein
MPVRPEVVNSLVSAAMDGMKAHEEYFTSAEMISACFTITQRIISVVLEQNPSQREKLIQAIESLLIECADTTKRSN